MEMLKRLKIISSLNSNVWFHLRRYNHKISLRRKQKSIDDLFKFLIAGDRGSLASCITLVESTKESHKIQANDLLSRSLNYLKKNHSVIKPSFRIGLSGSPGAGKSTFIETLGTKLVNEGHKVAVLAIDPSSIKSGGSLLGDRTRMVELSHNPNAYIRPSPTAGTLGGVAKKTNEAIILCEAAGYDIILVETVGIGQSEISVSDMVDMFVLILPPASGDELQGIKKGIVEMVDLVLINKADGDLLPSAKRVQSEYTSALKLLRRHTDIWHPRVYPVSSLHNEGFDKVWWKMQQFKEIMLERNVFHLKRRQQYKAWMWSHIRDDIMTMFMENKDMQIHIKKYEGFVKDEVVTPSMAANSLLKIFNNGK